MKKSLVALVISLLASTLYADRISDLKEMEALDRDSWVTGTDREGNTITGHIKKNEWEGKGKIVKREIWLEGPDGEIIDYHATEYPSEYPTDGSIKFKKTETTVETEVKKK